MLHAINKCDAITIIIEHSFQFETYQVEDKYSCCSGEGGAGVLRDLDVLRQNVFDNSTYASWKVIVRGR